MQEAKNEASFHAYHHRGYELNELRPFQKEGVKFLASRTAALLADEMGLGKTVQAICAANELKAKKILVICPAVVKLNWQRELKTWLTEPLKIQILNGRKHSIDATADVIILNYDLLISPDIFTQLLRLKFAVGIFDESHYLKSRSAKRTKAVLLKGGVASRCVYKWFLTGTPILNRPIELYPVLKSVAPKVIAPYDSYDLFAKRFCAGFWDGFQLVATGASNMDDLSVRLKSGFMLRRLKKDHLKELPDKQYQLIGIPADGKMKNLMQKEFSFHKGDANYQEVGADGAELAIIRHELALSKVKTCVDHIEDVLEETPKVLIFAYHKDVIAQLRTLLNGYNPMVITGDTPMKERQAGVDRFQNDPTARVFIGQIQAAGVGITLTAASTVIFVESSWVPGEIDQAVDRAHRIGQKDSVLVQFLVIEESLEEHMIRTIIDKKQTINKIVDENSDVAYMFT